MKSTVVDASDTRQRLLDAAEQLFAEHGIEATSLRSVIARAGTNLASVHYHFGSKEALVREVFRRRMAPINQERLSRLERIETDAGDSPPSLELIITAFVEPALRLHHEPENDCRNLRRLMGRIHAEPEELQQLIWQQFEEVMHRFADAIGRALPHLSPAEIFWRFKFSLGAMAITMMGPGKLDQEFGLGEDHPDIEDTIKRLVDFLAAGMRAPMPVANERPSKFENNGTPPKTAR